MSKEMVTEPLCTTIKTELSDDGKQVVVNVGNTGLEVSFRKPRYSDHSSFFNFIPEGKVDPSPLNAAKYATMLGVAFLELHQWINDASTQEEFELERRKLANLFIATNSTMINCLKRLFEKSNTKDIVSTSGLIADIDLQKFLSLNEKDPLIISLHNYQKRAKRIKVVYDKED